MDVGALSHTYVYCVELLHLFVCCIFCSYQETFWIIAAFVHCQGAFMSLYISDISENLIGRRPTLFKNLWFVILSKISPVSWNQALMRAGAGRDPCKPGHMWKPFSAQLFLAKSAHLFNFCFKSHRPEKNLWELGKCTSSNKSRP